MTDDPYEVIDPDDCSLGQVARGLPCFNLRGVSSDFSN
jgi:hypothetical protein